jgi:hypothetical protein
MKSYIISKFTGRDELRDDVTDIERDYEILCQSDQVMYFFEYEVDTYSSVISEVLKQFNIQDTNTLDKLRYDCIV